MGTDPEQGALAAAAGASDAARTALQDALRGQRDELLVLAGHDLRNAVGILDSALAMALELPETAASMQGMMRRAIYRMGILTRAMVDLDQLQRGVMPLAATARSLISVVEPVVDAATEAAATKAVTFDVSACAGLDVVMDPTLVEHLLAALLEHALGNAPSESVLRVSARRLSPERLELRVVHGGRAVSPETSSTYFTTLPLRFARAAAARHGGDVTVESPVEDGVGFAFVTILSA